MPTDEANGSRTYTEADYTDFAHTGPGTLAGRWMRMFWQPVYRLEDLPPGYAKPIRILGEDFTLYRGEGGAPHAVAFRCAHRASASSSPPRRRASPRRSRSEATRWRSTSA